MSRWKCLGGCGETVVDDRTFPPAHRVCPDCEPAHAARRAAAVERGRQVEREHGERLGWTPAAARPRR